MLFIVEYVETMYVYTLKYVYIYRTYVYMYLYVNKESLLNLALACGRFDLNVACMKTQSKTKAQQHLTEHFVQVEFVFPRRYLNVCFSELCTSLGRVGSAAFHDIWEMKHMFWRRQSLTVY